MPASVIPVTGLILGPVGAVSQTDFPLTTPRNIKANATTSPNFGDLLTLSPDNTYLGLNDFINGGGVLASNTPLGVAQQNVKTNTNYPTQGSAQANITQSGNYPPTSIADCLTRGTINVFVNYNTGTQYAGMPVFVRTSLNGAIPNGIVGGIEAAPDGTVAGAAAAGNTGNATISAPTLGTLPANGVYTVVYQSATAFRVYDPNGRYLGAGVNGTPFTSTGVNFTATAGATPMVRGDGFNITTTMKTVPITNIVFKTGILSTDPVTGKVTAQVTLLERLMP